MIASGSNHQMISERNYHAHLGLRTVRATWMVPGASQRKKHKERVEVANFFAFLAENLKQDNYNKIFKFCDRLTPEASETIIFFVTYPFIGPDYIYKHYEISKLFRATLLPLVSHQKLKSTLYTLPIAWLQANVVIKHLHATGVGIPPVPKIILSRDLVVINLSHFDMTMNENSRVVQAIIKHLGKEIIMDVFPVVRFIIIYTTPHSSNLKMIAGEITGNATHQELYIGECLLDSGDNMNADVTKVMIEEINSISSSMPFSKLMETISPFNVDLLINLYSTSIKVYQCGVELIFYFNCKHMPPEVVRAFCLKKYTSSKKVCFWGGFNQRQFLVLKDRMLNKMMDGFKIESSSPSQLHVVTHHHQRVKTFQLLPYRHACLLLSQFVSAFLITCPPRKIKHEGWLRLYKVQGLSPDMYVLFKQSSSSSALYTREGYGWLNTYPCEQHLSATKEYVFHGGDYVLNFQTGRPVLIMPGGRSYSLQELSSQEAIKQAGIRYQKRRKVRRLVLSHITPLDTAIARLIKEVTHLQLQGSTLVNEYLLGYSFNPSFLFS